MDIGMRSLHPAAADHSVSIRGSRCTALIILSLRSRAVVFHYCSSCLRVRSWASAGVTARQRWSRSHGRKRNGSREDSHTRSVRWPAPLRASALKEQISLKEYTGDRVFLKMSYHPCVSGRLRTVTITASRVWAFSTLRKLSWMVHVLLVGTWPSRSCAIDSAVSNMAGSLCLCRDLAFVLAQNGAAQHPVESEVIWGLRWGLPQVEFLTPQALRSRRGYRWFGLGPLLSGVPHPFPSVPPLMTRCQSLHRRASPLSPGMTTRLRCPLWVW